MHDLVRLYARQLSNEYAEADGWEEAVDRLLGYYLHAAAAADAHFHALPGSEVPTSFMWSDDALAWQDAEHTRLAAAVAVAAKSGRDRITMILPLLLVVYLDWRRRFDDWFGAAAFCADTARQQNEDTTPINFANAIQKVRIFEKISIASPDIADFLRGISDRHGETTAHTNLVDALQQLQRFEETLNACQDAVTVYLPTSQRTSGRNIRTELANALQQVLRFEEALNACQDATAGFRETGERRGEGTAITNLANALHEVHRFGTTIFLREGPPDHDS
jgi:tetratricopeptide (TPR) repeat protein